MSSPTDIELMESVREGDVRQLAQLFNRHHVKLYNFYFRLTGERHASEDMVQEVFFRMLKYRHTFRGEGEFSTWMYHLARNVHADQYRKKGFSRSEQVDPDEVENQEPHAQKQMELDQDRDLLGRALARLSVEKREVLILSRYQDLRYEEIAGVLGCSVEAVKVRVHRALNDLRRVFFELSGEKAHD